MKTQIFRFLLIFFVLRCSLEVEAAPTDAKTPEKADFLLRRSVGVKAAATNPQRLGNAKTDSREADGNGPLVVETVEAGKVFLVVKERRTWKDARAACKRMGGDLAELPYYKDFERLNSISESEDYHWFWLGGYLNETGPNWKEKFIWNSGEPIPYEYLYWRTDSFDEPNAKRYNCLVLTFGPSLKKRNGEHSRVVLGTLRCDGNNSHSYICEI